MTDTILSNEVDVRDAKSVNRRVNTVNIEDKKSLNWRANIAMIDKRLLKANTNIFKNSIWDKQFVKTNKNLRECLIK